MTPDFRPRRALAALWRDRRGVTAVEFALIAPVLLLFYCGMAELTEAMMAQRRLSHLTSSIGDIVARRTQFSNADRAEAFEVGKLLMAPFPTSTLHMCVVSIVSDAAGRDTVEWSERSDTQIDCPAATTVVDIPVSVLPASQSVIMSKGSYDYDSPVKLVMPSILTFERTFYLRPRLSEKILRVS